MLGCANSGLFAVYSVSVSSVYVCTSSSLPTIFNRFVWISFETMCTDDNLQQICTSFSSSFSFSFSFGECIVLYGRCIYCVRNQNQKTTIGWKIIITIIIMKWIQWNVHLLRDNVSNSNERQSSRHMRCVCMGNGNVCRQPMVTEDNRGRASQRRWECWLYRPTRHSIRYSTYDTCFVCECLCAKWKCIRIMAQKTNWNEKCSSLSSHNLSICDINFVQIFWMRIHAVCLSNVNMVRASERVFVYTIFKSNHILHSHLIGIGNSTPNPSQK